MDCVVRQAVKDLAVYLGVDLGLMLNMSASTYAIQAFVMKHELRTDQNRSYGDMSL